MPTSSTFGNYRFRVDFEGSAPGDTPVWTDVTAWVRKASYQVGRTHADTLLSAAAPGVCTLELNNINGEWNPYTDQRNPTPTGGRILIEGWEDGDTAHSLWGGHLEGVQTFSGVNQLPTVVVHGVGPLKWLRRIDNDTFLYLEGENKKSGAVINELLDKVNWPDSLRDIDTGKSTMHGPSINRSKRFGTVRNLVNVVEAMIVVARGEFGFLREDTQGRVVFEDRDRRVLALNTTVVGRWTDDKATAEPTRANSELGFVSCNAVEKDHTVTVRNHFSAELTSYEQSDVRELPGGRLIGSGPQGVYGESRPILPGQELRYEFNLEPESGLTQWFVHPYEEPVRGTDFTIVADSNDQDISDRMSVRLLETTYTRAKVAVKYPADRGAFGAATITLLKLRGALQQEQGAIRETAANEDSISTYGRREFKWPAQMVTNRDEAVRHVKALAAAHGVPTQRLEMKVNGARSVWHLKQVLARGVSDRIRVFSEGTGFVDTFDATVGREAFIERAVHTLTVAGGREPGVTVGGKMTHEVVYSLSDVALVSPWFRQGAAVLGLTDRIYY